MSQGRCFCERAEVSSQFGTNAHRETWNSRTTIALLPYGNRSNTRTGLSSTTWADAARSLAEASASGRSATQSPAANADHRQSELMAPLPSPDQPELPEPPVLLDPRIPPQPGRPVPRPVIEPRAPRKNQPIIEPEK